MANELFEIPVRRINGVETNLSEYRGDVLLIVNVASKCGLTPQYAGLETLYENYRERGFQVLGFPANDFMNQEPGDSREIQEFCDATYKIQFPLFDKISVKGKTKHRLYEYLVGKQPLVTLKVDDSFETKLNNYGQVRDDVADVLWNFEKFLVSRTGQVVARFAPDVTAEDARLIKTLEFELAQ